MKVEDVKKVAVMGAGDMGHGIAEVALLAGYKVAMRDIEQRFVDKGLSRIKESLDKLVEKQKITADNQKTMLANIKTFVDIAESVKDADFVVEAVPEIMDLKKQVFQALDKAAPKHAILASNTSNMSITEIAAVTKRPEQVVGVLVALVRIPGQAFAYNPIEIQGQPGADDDFSMRNLAEVMAAQEAPMMRAVRSFCIAQAF